MHPQDPTQQPQTQSTPLQTPPPQAPKKVNITVDANPFNHFVKGNKALFKTNFATALLILLISSASVAVMFILYAIVMWPYIKKLIFSPVIANSQILNVVYISSLFLLVGLVVWSVIHLALFHTMLESLKNKKISVSKALGFSLSRFGKAVSTLFVVAGIPLISGILLIILSFALHKLPALLVLLGLAYVVGVVIYAYKVTYTQYILADEDETMGPLGIIKRSSKLISKSLAAIIVYGIVMGMISSFISPSNFNSSSSSSSNLSSNNKNDFACTRSNGVITCTYADSSKKPVVIDVNTVKVTTFIVVAVVLFLATAYNGAIELVTEAGVAEIYEESKQLVDGTTAPTMLTSSDAKHPITPQSTPVAPVPLNDPTRLK